ncbi:MAG: tetratricopeptide repeat protein [bacterium]|nr:tetratricopeptide repeat protein [bacterium]
MDAAATPQTAVSRSTTGPLARLARWAARPWFWLALAAVVYTPLVDTEPNAGNVASDLAAIESLVNRGTFAIDGSPYLYTIDKFRIGGHYYSQKSPLFHLAAAIPGLAARVCGLTFNHHPDGIFRVLTFFMVILPMGWLLWLIYDHPWVCQRRPGERLALAGAFAASSLMTPFAVTLNHYALASACLMMAVRILTVRAARADAPGRPLRTGLGVGWWVAASLACDVPPAFLFGAGVAAVWGWGWVRGRPGARRLVAGLAGGVAPMAFCYAAFNIHLTGSPLPINTFNLAAFEFEGSYWADVRAQAEAGHPGYYQASYPRRLLHATLGHKGVYWMMPLLTGATVAALWLAWRRRPGWGLAAAWTIYLPLTIAITMRWAFDLSGGTYLVRHALAAVAPLYCVLGHPGLPRPGRGGRALLGAAALWGILVAGAGLMNPWSHNTLSAWPPLENIARFCLAHPYRVPTDWIGGLIRETSVDPALGWYDLALARRDAGDVSGAEEAFKHAIAVNPGMKLAYYHLGIVQDMSRRPAAAVATYERLLRLDPANTGAWNNMGLFALHAGRIDLAEKAYGESLRLAPDNASALVGMLYIDAALGRADPNSPRLRAALERYPDDPRLLRIKQEWDKMM